MADLGGVRFAPGAIGERPAAVGELPDREVDRIEDRLVPGL